jgi:hypothetical protein
MEISYERQKLEAEGATEIGKMTDEERDEYFSRAATRGSRACFPLRSGFLTHKLIILNQLPKDKKLMHSFEMKDLRLPPEWTAIAIKDVEIVIKLTDVDVTEVKIDPNVKPPLGRVGFYEGYTIVPEGQYEHFYSHIYTYEAYKARTGKLIGTGRLQGGPPGYRQVDPANFLGIESRPSGVPTARSVGLPTYKFLSGSPPKGESLIDGIREILH